MIQQTLKTINFLILFLLRSRFIFFRILAVPHTLKIVDGLVGIILSFLIDFSHDPLSLIPDTESIFSHYHNFLGVFHRNHIIKLIDPQYFISVLQFHVIFIIMISEISLLFGP